MPDTPYTTMIEVPVSHRFQIDNVIQIGPGTPSRTIFDIGWDNGRAVYRVVDVQGRTYTLPISDVDQRWQLVPVVKQFTVYEVKVEVEMAPWSVPPYTPGMIRQRLQGALDQLASDYRVLKVTSTVENREVQP